MRGLWAARGLAGADLDTLPRLRNPRPWQRALEQHGATSLNFLSFWNHSLSDSDFKLQSLILCEIPVQLYAGPVTWSEKEWCFGFFDVLFDDFISAPFHKRFRTSVLRWHPFLSFSCALDFILKNILWNHTFVDIVLTKSYEEVIFAILNPTVDRFRRLTLQLNAFENWCLWLFRKLIR